MPNAQTNATITEMTNFTALFERCIDFGMVHLLRYAEAEQRGSWLNETVAVFVVSAARAEVTSGLLDERFHDGWIRHTLAHDECCGGRNVRRCHRGALQRQLTVMIESGRNNVIRND